MSTLPRSRTRTAIYTLMQFCDVCGVRFFVREPDENKIPCCSKKCDRKLARSRHIESTVASVDRIDKIAPLTPVEVNRLRSHVYRCTVEQLERAHAFVMDRPAGPPSPSDPEPRPPKMNAQQVRIFTSLLNKVLPDLHHTFTEQPNRNREPTEMTRDELEALVHEHLVDVTPEPSDFEADHPASGRHAAHSTADDTADDPIAKAPDDPTHDPDLHSQHKADAPFTSDDDEDQLP